MEDKSGKAMNKLLGAFLLFIVGIVLISPIANEVRGLTGEHGVTKASLDISSARVGLYGCFDTTPIEITKRAYTISVTNVSNITGGLVASACYNVAAKGTGDKGWDLKFVNASCCSSNLHTDKNETVTALGKTTALVLVPDSNESLINQVTITCATNATGVDSTAPPGGTACMDSANYTSNSTGQVILIGNSEFDGSDVNFTYTYKNVYNNYYNATNTTYIDYAYTKIEQGWARTGLNLVAGFFALAIFVLAAGFAISAMKDYGIIAK